jgi:hypothetical protein
MENRDTYWRLSEKLMVLNYTYFIWKQNYKFEGESAFVLA